jgi:circadian clock protein KaiC
MPTQSTQFPRSATGIPGLDDILNGGFLPHRLYLIDGDPGAGKTTLSLQYLMEGQRRGEKGLYVTLSETREELFEVARSHGWSLDGLEIVELVASEKDLTSDTQLTMYHPSEVELSETTKAVLEAVQRVNPQRVVFDSLSEMRLLAQNSLRYRRQILALKQFFIGRQCTVLLLDDRTNDDKDTQLQSIAHGVLAMEQMAPEYGAERRRLRIMKFRGTQYRGGYHDFSIVPGGLVVYPRLIAAEHNGNFPQGQIKSGVAALDSLLGGGPDRGTSTLLIGPAGAGKSTIAVGYAVAAAKRGDHAVVFAFDESAETLTLRMNALGVTFDLGVGPGKIRVKQIDPAEVSPGEFGHMVRDCVERDGARVVIIDSLNGYINSMPEERFLTIQLHELLNYLARKGCTTFMVVAQHGLMGSGMQSPVDASYLADSVVLLRYFENAGKVKKAISVVKKRSGAHEESIRELRFNGNGIYVSEPLEQFQGILTGVPAFVGTSAPAAPSISDPREERR